MKVTALVPARLRSERLPYKNLQTLCGRPLVCWILDALAAAQHVEEIVVDTDSDAIAEIVRAEFPHVQILRRPEDLCGPGVDANQLIRWDLDQLGSEHYLQTHATSPLLRPATIAAAAELYVRGLGAFDSLVGVTDHRSWFYAADRSPINHSPQVLTQHQLLAPIYEDNSALYLFSRSSFVAAGGRVGKRPQFFPIPKAEAIDIDWPEDLEVAEALLERRLRNA